MLKNLGFFFSICLIVNGYASNTTNENKNTGNKDGVECYSEDNCTGEKKIIPAGNYKLKDLGKIKSIKIPNNYELLFSNDAEYKSKDSKSYPIRKNIVSNKNSKTEIKNTTNNNYTYNLSDIGKFTYLYIAKLDNTKANGIATHADYDPKSKHFFGRGLTVFPNINEKVESILIDTSPDLKEIPDLKKYKKLKSISLMLEVFKNKNNIQADLDKIFEYIAYVRVLDNIEIQKEIPQYCKLIGTKFFAVNLTQSEKIPNNITELYLINSNLEIDFAKYLNLKKIALFGSTFKNLNDTKWKEEIRQIYNLKDLTWLLLPPSFTGTIPLHPNPRSKCKLEYLGALNASSIAKEAFYKCYSLKEIYFPNMTTVQEMAFSNCTKLKIANMPNVEIIKQAGFDWCYSLEKFGVVSGDTNGCYAPKLKTVAREAFHQDNPYPAKWKEIILPECETIERNGFCRPGPLIKLDAPKCKSIGVNAFWDCKFLKEINLPMVETIESGAFNSCSALECLILPKCKSIGSNAFRYAYRLKQLELPQIKTISSDAFRGSIVLIPRSS